MIEKKFIYGKGVSFQHYYHLSAQTQTINERENQISEGKNESKDDDIKHDEKIKMKGLRREELCSFLQDLAIVGPKLHTLYEIEKEILGSGNFGDVRKAKKRRDENENSGEELVVIKKQRRDNQHWKEDTKTEVEILKILKSNGVEGVVTLDDQCDDPMIDDGVMVFPYKPSDEIVRGDVTMKDIKDYSRAIFTSLSQIHSAGVIHRDVSVDNFLYEGASKKGWLIDFGMGVKKGEKMDYSLMGKELYQSPEIAKGAILNASEECCAVDIWASGMCILQAIVGIENLWAFRDIPKKYFWTKDGKRSGKEALRLWLQGEYRDKSTTERKSRYSEIYHMIVKMKFGGDQSKAIEMRTDLITASKLLAQCFEQDFTKRITAEEALQHPFLHE